ncbi:hypothetical protein N7523_007854 [Penicillium sp. IBT 18751x]|nr:hypothetical protein N7523_007854 [Penicillium sp. IBT 18751x]
MPEYPAYYDLPRPCPRFCIFRPGGQIAPLIALDELPSWFQVYCNIGVDMIMGLQPVTLTYIPRDGEYDVICHNCSPSVSLNHRSRSERDEDSPKLIPAESQGCTGAFIPPIADAHLPGVGIKIPLAEPFPLMEQPLRDPAVQTPFGAACMYNLATLNANILGASATLTKGLVLPTQSSSASDPLPGVSPDSSKSSQPDVKASVTASLANVARRASIGKMENQHHSGPTTPIDPPLPASLHSTPHSPMDSLSSFGHHGVINSPAELEAIASAIAASICGQSPAESLASEVSLTAAVEFLKKRKGITSLSRRASLHRNGGPQNGTILKAHGPIGPVRKIHTATGGRQVQGGRRRTGKPKRRKPKSSDKSTEKITRAPCEQEQVNASTKRRDRREKLQQRQSEATSYGQYPARTRIPLGQCGAAHR